MIRHKYIAFPFFILLVFALSSCLQKQVDIKLPPFKSQLVVEGYLEKNKPVQIAISQTSDFFSTPDISAIFLKKAKVILSYNNIVDTLVYNPIPDFKHMKWFNYQLKNADSIPLTNGITYYLKVIDSTGRTATAQTTWFDSARIDSVKEMINPVNSIRIDTSMRVFFRDNATTQDFYRFRAVNHTRRDSVRVDVYFEDQLFNGQTFSLSTGRRFHKGDTCDITLFHIDNAYYTFLSTSSDADNANGNPFASPATIISNIKGGTGIFTAMPESNRRVVFK
jgi:LEA14-like dessication related protein